VLELAFVLAPGQNRFFDTAEVLCDELRELGVTASVNVDGFPDPHPERVYALLAPHEHFAPAHPAPVSDDVWRRTILISTEQPETGHFRENVALAAHAGAVLDINRRSVAAYAQGGVQAEHLQLGYTPRWDHLGRAGGRDLDVLFLGGSSPRREWHLASYAGPLSRRRCHLGLSGEGAKVEALLRAKVLLNLHQGVEPYFEWLHALEAIHCGCAVVSEASSDYAPLVAGEHVLFGRIETLAALADELLSDGDRCSGQQAAAYEFIRQELPLSRSVERLATIAEQVSRAPVPASRPMAASADREPPAAEPVRPQPLGSTSDPDSSLLLRALKDVRLEVMDLRRLQLRTLATDEHGSAPPVVRQVAVTAGHRARPHPKVSVVTALYNQSEHVIEALNSLEDSRFRDFEAIVVDDGSTDDSGETVRRWMAAHDRTSVQLLNHPLNRGLPSSRNAAIDFARGRYLLILDSDNQLYPNCLERLVEALEADPEAAFAYGILQRFGPTGPIGLVSHLGWEPDRLRTGNYIDAFALLRASTVREIGGYTTDRRLYGWEDYDLWCALAERGDRPVHVPEIVGRYRVSPTSMIALTNISTTAAYAALIERHPNLFEGAVPPL
jgi:hypothetical protein